MKYLQKHVDTVAGSFNLLHMANTEITFEDNIEEPAPHCANCAEAMPYGEEVRIGDWLYCGLCAHEEREASREEVTQCR